MKTSAIRLVSTFFLLWLSVYLDYRMEVIGAYILILSLGILHGANDITLLERLSDTNKGNKQVRIVLAYIISVLLVASIFYIIPAFALLIFVLLSAYHFGEEHWDYRLKNSNLINRLFYLCYGLLILSMLFYLHRTEVENVIQAISGYTLPNSLFWVTMIISGVLLLISGLSTNAQSKKIIFNFKELFYLVIFYIVFRSTSLLWAFAIYFVIWHAIPSLANQLFYLHGDISAKSLLNYIKSSIWYWLISIFGIGLLYWLFKEQDYSFIALLFPFIAALTFPHVVVMLLMGKHKQEEV